MAKRFVTSEMSSDSKLALVADENPTAALMWPWLITHLDDWGRICGNPLEIKLKVFPAFPYTTTDIQDAIALFDKYGLAHCYEVNAKPYIAVNPDSFYKHQTYIGAKRKEEDKSKCPPPPNPPWNNHQQLSANIADNLQTSANVLEQQQESANIVLSLSHSHSKDNNNSSLQTSVATTSCNSLQGISDNDKQLQEQAPDNNNKSKSNGYKKVFQESTDEYKLALLLRQKILENLPSARVPRASPDGLAKWCLDINRMIRLDKRDPDEIASVIRWAQSDSFWRSNILSARKLREKWETLVLQSKRDNFQKRGESLGEKHPPAAVQSGKPGKYSNLIPIYSDG